MRRLEGERGFAMITVILVTGIVSLLAMIGLHTAVSTLGQTGNRKSWEQALHLAEAAVARALALVEAEPSYSTDPTAPETRAAAVALAADNETNRGREGEFSWIVPAGQRVAYGIGYVPSKAGPRITRVLRVDFRVVNPFGPKAMLTEGNLELGGDALVSRIGGNVHANGNLDVSGSAVIEGDATATGVALCSGAASSTCPNVQGDFGGGRPAVPVPAVDPRTYRWLTSYDLCPDGLARQTAAVPCTGTVGGSGVLGWNGWKFLAGKWKTDATPSDAGYYVFQGDAQIVGVGTSAQPWRAAVVVEGTGVSGAMLSGDVEVSGQAYVRGITGVALVAHRDMKVSPGQDKQIEGAVVAGEHVSLEGGGTVIGSVVAAGTANSTGSPVANNKMGGNFTVRAVSSSPSGAGGVRPARWDEL